MENQEPIQKMSTGENEHSSEVIHPNEVPVMMESQRMASSSRLRCYQCSVLLEHDASATYVQCFSCSTMNSVVPNSDVGGKVLSMMCSICGTSNLAPYGVPFVRCGSCGTISQVSHCYTYRNGR